MQQIYGYARISKDEDKKNYGSIETQINLITEYSQKTFKRKPNRIFIDDDVSGYIPIENRPDFYKLFQLVEEAQEKPIVLMKDWSRLSRNNGIAQTILTNWKRDDVELILVKEMGAPFNILKDNDDIVGITTWINERYVKETSRKVRDALNDRMKQGIYISGPRYGYIKGKNGTLTVNEEVREAIETIYNLYEEGLGTTAIANKLNTEYDFKNPSMVEAERFKRDNEDHRNIRRSVREYWETDMVSKILKDETYTGTLITHKKEVKGIHGKAKVLPKEDNYRFENHHESIISKEQFDRVQKLMKERAETISYYKRGKHYYIFSGFIRCGECGAAGTGYMERGKKFYECLNYAKYRKLRCVYNSVREDYILENFKIFLKDLRLQYKDLLHGMNLHTIKTKSKNNKEKLKVKLDKIKNEYKTMQIQKVKELSRAEILEEKEIIEETYSDIIKTKMNEIKEITYTIQRLEQETKDEKVKNIKSAIEYFDEIIKSDVPSKQILSQVLDKVIITKNKNLEFKLKINIDELI